MPGSSVLTVHIHIQVGTPKRKKHQQMTVYFCTNTQKQVLKCYEKIKNFFKKLSLVCGTGPQLPQLLSIHHWWKLTMWWLPLYNTVMMWLAVVTAIEVFSGHLRLPIGRLVMSWWQTSLAVLYLRQHFVACWPKHGQKPLRILSGFLLVGYIPFNPDAVPAETYLASNLHSTPAYSSSQIHKPQLPQDAGSRNL